MGKKVVIISENPAKREFIMNLCALQNLEISGKDSLDLSLQGFQCCIFDINHENDVMALSKIDNISNVFTILSPVLYENLSQESQAFLQNYIFKPFKPLGFLNRLHILLNQNGLCEIIHIGPYILHTRTGIFQKQDEDDIVLTEKERDVLIFLYQNPQGVEKEELLREIWGYADDAETHTIETHIYRLRQKIEQDPSNPKILITDEHGYKILF